MRPLRSQRQLHGALVALALALSLGTLWTAQRGEEARLGQQRVTLLSYPLLTGTLQQIDQELDALWGNVAAESFAADPGAHALLAYARNIDAHLLGLSAEMEGWALAGGGSGASLQSALRLLSRLREDAAQLRDRVSDLDRAGGDLLRGQEARGQVRRHLQLMRLRTGELREHVQRSLGQIEEDIEARRRRGAKLRWAALSLLWATLLWLGWHSRRTLALVSTLTRASAQLRSGSYRLPALPEREDEVGLLIREFAAMAQTLEDRERRLRRQHDELERAYADRITAQRAQVAAERLATIGEMASRITHEVRNPLASLRLNVDLLTHATEATDPDELRDILASMERELERMTLLTEGYLNQARPEAPPRTPIALAPVVNDVIHQLAPILKRDDITVSTGIENVDPVLANENEVRQLLLNLLQNAQDAVLRGKGARVIDLRLRQEGQEVLLTVDDSGQGIGDDILPLLFEPFASADHDGTGLGLAICRQIVVGQGASIDAIAHGPRGGARFRVRWPLLGDDEP